MMFHQPRPRKYCQPLSPRRYCTKRRKPWLDIPGWYEGMTNAEYIRHFDAGNNLKGCTYA